MGDHQVDSEIGSTRDSKLLDVTFKTLWEKIKKTAELIERLKEENRALKEKVSELEEQASRTETELREFRNAHLHETSRNNNFLTSEEMEALKIKIRELITKISSHL